MAQKSLVSQFTMKLELYVIGIVHNSAGHVFRCL